MKHLPVFFLTLLGMIGSAWSTEYCSEIDGTWEGDASARMQYVCTGHNSCALTRVISGVTCTATYTLGSWDNTVGRFPYTASRNSGTNTCSPGSSWSGHLYMGAVGCSQMGDDKFDGPNIPDLIQIRTSGLNSVSTPEIAYGYTVVCELPGTLNGASAINGESASVGVSVEDGGENFKAPLNDHGDSAFNFGGRSTIEDITGPQNYGTYQCNGPLSFGGGAWKVSQAHNLSVGGLDDGTATDGGYDFIGYDTFADLVFEANIRRQDLTQKLPCYYSVWQQMFIDCPTGNGGVSSIAYQKHQDWIKFDETTTVVINRNSTPVSVLQVGNPRKVFRADQFAFHLYVAGFL